eukprot:PhM_4_TR3476/c0_g1_i2/m.47001
MRPHPFRVLCIDGGGVRGVIPARVLSHMEEKSGRRLHDLFDLVCGTSTGALISTLAVLSDKSPRGSLPASAITELYIKLAKQIFPTQEDVAKDKSVLSVVTEVTNVTKTVLAASTTLYRPRYSVDKVNELLHEYCGEETLSSVVKPVMVPSYEITTSQPTLFTTRDAREGNIQDYSMKDIMRATTAAPTFFPPHVMGDRAYIDGCVFANNPSMVAYLEARNCAAGPDIIVVSLGTGRHIEPICRQASGTWGLLQWASPAIDIFLDSSAESVHCQLSALLPKHQYFRLQLNIAPELGRIDNSTTKNINELCSAADNFIHNKTEDIDRIIDVLTAHL